MKKKPGKPGWQKNRKRTPDNCLLISDSWRRRKRKQIPEKVGVRLNTEEMKRLMKDAEAAKMSTAAYIRSALQSMQANKGAVNHD